MLYDVSEENMAWKITMDDACAEETPYAVVDSVTGNVEGCYATEKDAQAAIVALDGKDKAAAVIVTPVGAEYLFHSVLAVEGTPTSDGRLLEIGGATWRNPPLPLMAQMVATETGGHTGSVLVGRIEQIKVEGDKIIANGFIDPETDAGQQVLELLRSQTLRFVSIDIGSADIQQTEDPEVPMLFTSYEIMGATVVPFPALAGAVIWLADHEVPVEADGVSVEIVPVEEDVMETITAAAPLLPPKKWFTNPGFDRYTKWTVLDTGQVFGHLAPWGTCHTGYKGTCVTPPNSKTDYAYFASGTCRVSCDCDDHTMEDVRTGVVTMDGGHAAGAATGNAAIAHYDNTCKVVADIAVGEDAYGIWMAGALRSTVTDEQVRALRGGGGLSGDWRPFGGNLELVAALKVNVPGFPIVASTKVHVEPDGRQTSLVASFKDPLPTPEDNLGKIEERLTALETATTRLDSIAEPLRPLAAERIWLGLNK